MGQRSSHFCPRCQT
ncbi:MAG: zinc finger domain-containing protein [Actinomycetota bacterium]